MYAMAVRALPEGAEWSYEAKLDGYRCLAATAPNGEVILWSRRGLSFNDRFPEIARACKFLPANSIIDGEVIAIDEKGKISFNTLQHRRTRATLQYYVFDVPMLRGRTLLHEPLGARREQLAEVLRGAEYPIIRSQAFTTKPADIIRAAEQLELEGVIAKNKESCYEPGRHSHHWLKLKLNRSQEFVIGGITPGNPFDALIVGAYDSAGDLTYVSKVRNGFVPLVRRDVASRLKTLRIDTCPFANLPEKKRTQWALTREEMKNCLWVMPQQVA